VLSVRQNIRSCTGATLGLRHIHCVFVDIFSWKCPSFEPASVRYVNCMLHDDPSKVPAERAV